LILGVRLISCNTDEQKRIEFWYLNAARITGVPIPSGEIPGEKPDFRFQGKTATLGIEVSEAMRPASSNHGIVPVYEEAVQNQILKIAQRAYYTVSNARPIHVGVTFSNIRGKAYDKSKLARALTEFVQAKAAEVNPVAIFWRGEDEVPDGFDWIRMNADPDPLDWWMAGQRELLGWFEKLNRAKKIAGRRPTAIKRENSLRSGPI
jgi:hypothetical protein